VTEITKKDNSFSIIACFPPFHRFALLKLAVKARSAAHSSAIESSAVKQNQVGPLRRVIDVCTNGDIVKSFCPRILSDSNLSEKLWLGGV